MIKIENEIQSPAPIVQSFCNVQLVDSRLQTVDYRLYQIWIENQRF